MSFLSFLLFLLFLPFVASDPLHAGRYYNASSFSSTRRVGGTAQHPNLCLSDPTEAICRVTNNGLAACVASLFPCASHSDGWIRIREGDYETTSSTGVVVAAVIGWLLVVPAVVAAVWLWRRSAPQPDDQVALEV